MNLYEINSKIENFNFEFDEDTGEVLNLDELDELKLARNDKIENIALFIKNLKADEKTLNDEIKSLQERLKAKSKKIDNLSKYLEMTLGMDNFESSKVKLSWRKSSEVVIDDEDAFLDKYYGTKMVNSKTTLSIDKKEVKNYLKENVCELAHIEENQNLQIK